MASEDACIPGCPETVTSRESRIIDLNSEALGVSTIQLMEAAGRAIADTVESLLGGVSGKLVVVFAGPGGNGGDGMAAARYLASRGARVVVYLLGRPQEIGVEASRRQYEALELMDVSVELKVVRTPEDLPEAVRADAIIDALLGVGVRGPVKGLYARAIELINRSQGLRVAVDVPSGLDPDTGNVLGVAVKADATVTLHRPKPGLLKRPELVGKLVVADIGVPPEACIYVGPGDLMVLYPRRSWFSHKGENGRVLVVGGSAAYTGAPRLTALAALRTGVDLVYLAAPEPVVEAAAVVPDIVPVKLRGEILTREHLDKLVKVLDRVDALAVGPGLGLEDETREAVLALIEEVKRRSVPVVADADALKHLASRRELLGRGMVVTPHAGEYRILFGGQLPAQLLERVKQVVEASRKHGGVVVLLKGVVDIITDGSRVKLNKCHAPAMTVGGTGDTLTGIVAALAAKKLNLFEAAYLGAFINGLAGCIAYAEKGESMTASDLVDCIPKALKNPMEEFRRTLVYRRLPTSSLK